MAGVWSNIKMRMTLGKSSQPRAHLNFESVFAKLAQPFVPRKTGGECEVWQRPSHAAKMQRVREALLMAQAALAGSVGPQVQPFVGANAVAAAMLPEFPAVSKKHLSLRSIDEQHEEEEEEAEDEAVAAVESDDDEDSACDVNSVAASAIHDGDEDTNNENESPQEVQPEGQADEVREVQQSPAAVNVGAAEAAGVMAAAATAEPFLLHSPQYSPLWSPIRSDAVDASGLGLASLECATANGGLSGSLSPWRGLVSSISSSVSASVDDAEHGIHDFAMPSLDVDAAWQRWMRTE